MFKLINDEEIISLVTEYHLSGVENRHVLAKQVAQAQLDSCEKQYQAGIKKVVDFVNEHKLYAGNISIPKHQWQTFLKEHGMEG